VAARRRVEAFVEKAAEAAATPGRSDRDGMDVRLLGIRLREEADQERDQFVAALDDEARVAELAEERPGQQRWQRPAPPLIDNRSDSATIAWLKRAELEAVLERRQ
jgi:hypothetical protein